MMKDKLLSFFWYFPYEMRRGLFKLVQPQLHSRYQEMRKANNSHKKGRHLSSFDEHHCIFIHIPKCAGRSITNTLFGERAGGHIGITRYQLIYNQEEFDSYFKFTFVRNPWDRLVSAYTFLKEGGINKADKRWADQNLTPYADFDSFVKGWLTPKSVHTWKHFIPQYKFICEPNSYEPVIDFIGYFENLKEDFAYIQDRLGIESSSLLHINRTQKRKKDYRNYYTADSQEIVATVYREDIQLFGYDFENRSLEKQLSNRQPSKSTFTP